MYKTLLGATLLIIAGAAGAQQETLKQCAEIEDSLQRLTCYDNLAKAQQGKSEYAKEKAKGQGIAQERNNNAEQKASRSGGSSSSQRFGIEHKEKEDGQLDKMQVEVIDRKEGPYKKWRIVLANGQLWKQTDSGGYFSWDDNDTYYIERGALNSFFFGREGSNRRMRVQRVK